jgi:hypothetical protein
LAVSDTTTKAEASVILAVMADGIGDLTYATPEWVEVLQEYLQESVDKFTDELKGIKYTACEVAYNAPAFLHCGPVLAYHLTIDDGKVTAAPGELSDDDCDIKIQADHSIQSNICRVQRKGNDPVLVKAAMDRLTKLTRWEISGKGSKNKALKAVFAELHDKLAQRTMPRFSFMTPEWVSTARHILTTRAKKYADEIRDVEFTFSEEFTDTPSYAFPDGRNAGFWARCQYGAITIGAGALPERYEPADYLTKGPLTPIYPVGRTVNAAMTDEDNEEQDGYRRSAFKPEPGTKGPLVAGATSPSGKGPMPKGLSKVFVALHDELGKRTSGELPCDYDDSVKDAWTQPQKFDRDPGYDPSWVLYDQFDIYGNAR